MGEDSASSGAHPCSILVLEAWTMASSHRKATAWERLCARAWAGPVDRQLAGGTVPEASALHALRAFSPRHAGQSGSHSQMFFGRSWMMPPSRPIAVGPRAGATSAERSWCCRRVDGPDRSPRSPDPVSACGVAKVRALVHDGAGPLDHPAAGDALRRCVEDAIQAMDPQSRSHR